MVKSIKKIAFKNFLLIPEKLGLGAYSALFEKNPEQDTAQKTLEQIRKDVKPSRVNFLDLTGRTLEQLQQNWLTLDDKLDDKLAEGVSLFYLQGTPDGRAISELLYTIQVLSISDGDSLEAIHSDHKSIGFSYMNRQGKPAAFSISAIPNGDSEGKHRGWAISIIQNTPAEPEKRTITVFATADYVSTPGDDLVDMDSPETIEAQLKAAIENDAVFEVVKDVFNPDGTLNQAYLAILQDQIRADRVTDIDVINEIRSTPLLPVNQSIFKRLLNNFETEQPQCAQAGHELSHVIESLVDDQKNPLSTSELSQLNHILELSIKAINNPKDANNISELNDCSKKVSGKSSPLWKALGAALIAFTAAVLVVAGVLAAIPTGGASLGLVVAGVAALTAAGGAMIAYGQERGLAKKITSFKTALEDMKSTSYAEDSVSDNESDSGPNPNL